MGIAARGALNAERGGERGTFGPSLATMTRVGDSLLSALVLGWVTAPSPAAQHPTPLVTPPPALRPFEFAVEATAPPAPPWSAIGFVLGGMLGGAAIPEPAEDTGAPP